MLPSRLIVVLLCLLVFEDFCWTLVLGDTTDEVGSGDSPDTYVVPGTVPFGLCTVMVRESLCYSVLGSRVAVSYPSRLQISQNSSLSDLEVLHQYERAITDKMQFYRENGVQVEGQDCQETVLVATCLELYPLCSASPSRSSCSLSCDRWKLHVGTTCACSGADDCPSLLQQVADVCPLSEGPTLFTSSGVQCQRLSVDLHRRITSGTVSREAQSCQTLYEDAFCYPVLHTVQVATTSSHSLQGEVALERFNQLTQVLGRTFVNLTLNDCRSAMLLAACMSVYTPCACSGDGNFSQSGYCPDVDFALIVAEVLDVCQCTMLAQTCRLQLLLRLDRVEDAVRGVVPSQEEAHSCQRLPTDVLSQYLDLTTLDSSTTVTATATPCPTPTATPTPTGSMSTVTQTLSLPSPSATPDSSTGGNGLNQPTTPCPPFEDNAAVSLSSAARTLCLILSLVVAALLH